MSRRRAIRGESLVLTAFAAWSLSACGALLPGRLGSSGTPPRASSNGSFEAGGPNDAGGAHDRHATAARPHDLHGLHDVAHDPHARHGSGPSGPRNAREASTDHSADHPADHATNQATEQARRHGAAESQSLDSGLGPALGDARNPDTLDRSALATEALAPEALGADTLATAPPDPRYESLPAPSHLPRRRRLALWATHYSVHSAKEVAGRRQSARRPFLRDPKGRPLVRLQRRDWCQAAMNGSVRVERRDGTLEVFQFVRSGRDRQVDCRDIFPRHAAIGRSRFRKVRTEKVIGARGTPLIPYRSLAVDRRRFANGTLFFVPEAKGVPIKLPSGLVWEHDGYFYAADRGGGLKGPHVDLFLGETRRNPFKFAKSAAKHRFRAYVVTDPARVARMAAIHGLQLDELAMR